MRSETRTLGFLSIERLLFIMGIACVSWCALVAMSAWRYQSVNRSFVSRTPIATPPSDTGLQPAAPTEIPIGDPIGRLEVPRLHLSAVVANGDNDETLRVAIGHLPDTPLPWEAGNSALAGHRDTLLRALRNIRVDDDMRVITAHGDFAYRVKRILIVTPDDLSVLSATPQAALTVVTCYPFSYVGHAPKRFIVQAARVPGGPG
jgi:sortase A